MDAFFDRLGLAAPLIQAPMAGVQNHRLAAAVCQAGGLGSLPAAMLSADALLAELIALQDLTNRPFNVNFFCHAAPQPDAEREARWREALLPQMVRALKLPVIAAGGIVSAQGIQAARALGAAGVQMGTAYLCSDEAQTSALHRTALLSGAAQHTALTNLFTGRPARGIVNRVMRELGPLSSLAPAFPLATAGMAPLRAAAEAQGSSDFTPLWAGQNTAHIQARPAGDITQSFITAWRS